MNTTNRNIRRGRPLLTPPEKKAANSKKYTSLKELNKQVKQHEASKSSGYVNLDDILHDSSDASSTGSIVIVEQQVALNQACLTGPLGELMKGFQKIFGKSNNQG